MKVMNDKLFTQKIELQLYFFKMNKLKELTLTFVGNHEKLQCTVVQTTPLERKNAMAAEYKYLKCFFFNKSPVFLDDTVIWIRTEKLQL